MLDFGLAKLSKVAEPDSDETATAALTEEGTIVGTDVSTVPASQAYVYCDMRRAPFAEHHTFIYSPGGVKAVYRDQDRSEEWQERSRKCSLSTRPTIPSEGLNVCSDAIFECPGRTADHRVHSLVNVSSGMSRGYRALLCRQREEIDSGFDQLRAECIVKSEIVVACKIVPVEGHMIHEIKTERGADPNTTHGCPFIDNA